MVDKKQSTLKSIKEKNEELQFKNNLSNVQPKNTDRLTNNRSFGNDKLKQMNLSEINHDLNKSNQTDVIRNKEVFLPEDSIMLNKIIKTEKSNHEANNTSRQKIAIEQNKLVFRNRTIDRQSQFMSFNNNQNPSTNSLKYEKYPQSHNSVKISQSIYSMGNDVKSFREIDLNSIKSKSIISTNMIFDLYNGILADSEEIEVYLLVLKILDFDIKIISDVKSFVKFAESKFDEKILNLFMKRIGYCHFMNKISLVYEKSDRYMLNREKLGIQDLKNPKQLALSLGWLKTLIESINICHDFELKIALLHPSLLFVDQEGIKMIDYIFSEILKDYEFNSNLDVALFFGFYDIKRVNEIFRGENDSKLALKSDVILLCEVINFFYSENQKSSFSNYVYLIEKDFLLKNVKFQNFLMKNEVKEVKHFLSEVLNINFLEVKNIKDANFKFNEMVSSVLSVVNCEENDCKEESKLINLFCSHMLCNKCANEHACEKQSKVKDEFYNQFNKYKNKIEELKNMASKVNMPKQNFSVYFTKNIEPSFSKINNIHKKYETFLIMNEEKLNHMIEVVENILINKKTNEYQTMIKFKDDLKGKLKKIVTDVQQNLLKQNETNQKDQQGKNSFQKKKSIYEGILEKNIDQYDKLFEEFNKLNELINKYEDYLQGEKDLKMHLNYNINIKFLLGKIYEKSIDFLKELKDKHYTKFISKTKEFTKQLLESYKIFSDSHQRDIIEELEITEHRYLGTVELKQNIVLFYDTQANTNSDGDESYEKKIKLSYDEDITPKYIIPLCRWVNLKTRLIISGGIYKNVNGKEDTVKNVYYIDYEEDDEKDNLVRKVHKLPDMITARDQHCFIIANDFYLISIGGSKTETCEIFNFLSNEWTSLPNLDVPRYNCSAYVHNNLEVYLFFGLIGPPQEKNLQYSDNILRLKLYTNSNSEIGWDQINYKGDRVNICLNGIISMNDNHIYILGGRIPGENNYSNLTYTFDTELQTISESKSKLHKKLCFLECNFLKCNHNDYRFALYSSDFHLVKLNL